MTVEKLIELLKTYNQEQQILIATDEEGNGFGDIADDFGLHIYTDDENKEHKVLVLYPESFINPEDVVDDI